jgi:hypothetical protein
MAEVLLRTWILDAKWTELDTLGREVQVPELATTSVCGSASGRLSGTSHDTA